ncbi:hypothetical protein KFL_001240100 [Klebsormidium nitens]|uniref:Uncharacterized protein n=1 Tax=Klebsormidium nitens TaxID=105231 RepID=A0A1Y1I023_KLENI|nr:hypothetical protein KFL_001240100 [Klebsormidium nitens]|eukprot:GAQ82779.1 hypothetical protein KFL_001240100 [Klebsormidium nitens]
MAAPMQNGAGEAAGNAEAPMFVGMNEPLESVFARLLEHLERSGPLSGRRSHWIDLLRQDMPSLDRKQKIKTTFKLDEFREELESASSQDVRLLADSGFFKVLCACLRDADAETLACATECLGHCIRIVPELIEKAWAWGALRPVATLILKDWEVADEQALYYDLPLQHSLYFLATLGGPCNYEQLRCSEEICEISRKCLNWLNKQGVQRRAAEMLVALSKAKAESKDGDDYLPFVFNATLVLMFGSHPSLHSKGRPGARLESQEGLGAAVLHFIQLSGNPEFMERPEPRGIVENSTKLLLLLWLPYSSATDSDALRTRKKEIAEHPDILKVAQILKEEAESQSHPVKESTKACFAALVCLLTFEHPRPLPRATLESALRILCNADVSADWLSWDRWNVVLNRRFHDNTVSPTFLLTHFFPAFLTAFAVEANRCKPARIYGPGLRKLFGMVVFLSGCLWFSYCPLPMSWGTPTGKEAIVIPKELLPRLVDLMIETRAAAAMASLTGFAMYRTAGEACVGLAQTAVQMSLATLRRLNEQMIPALFHVSLDVSRDDEIMCLARMGRPSSCTDELVSGMPVFKVEVLGADSHEADTVR